MQGLTGGASLRQGVMFRKDKKFRGRPLGFSGIWYTGSGKYGGTESDNPVIPHRLRTRNEKQKENTDGSESAEEKRTAGGNRHQGSEVPEYDRLICGNEGRGIEAGHGPDPGGRHRNYGRLHERP